MNLCLWCPAHAHLETGILDGATPYFSAVAHARAETWRTGSWLAAATLQLARENKDQHRLPTHVASSRRGALGVAERRGGALASLVLLVIQGVLPLASLYLMKLMVDAVATALRSPNPDFHRVFWPIVGLGGVTLATALCNSLATLISEAQGQAVSDHVNSLIHAKSVAVDLDTTKTRNTTTPCTARSRRLPIAPCALSTA